MAYDVCMWAAEKNGESLIKSIRIKRVEEIPEIVNYWQEISDCVRITKERSLGSQTFKTLWLRSGYIDPF